MARILIIDDDSFMRDLLRSVLESDGHEVVDAENGELGVELNRQNPFPIVITDILMPEKEGIATIRDLKKEFPETRIIAISGGGISKKDYLPLARDLGAEFTFAKPFDPKEVRKTVERMLGDS